jgi:hypothetical protein
MRRVTLALVVVLLVGAIAVPAALASAQEANSSDTEYTIEDLRQDGKHYSVDGARIVSSEQRIYWLEHTPANQPWREVTKAENGPKFGSNQVLKTDTLYLRTIRAQENTESVTVKIVSWNRGTRTVETGNTTTEKTVATNVTVQEQQINLGPGWAMGEVNLPRHDEKKHVTMWIVGAEEDARWTFEHRSVATSQPIQIDTWGGFLVKVFQYVGVPVLIGGLFAGKKVRNAVESAGIGPQWGFGRWLLTITFLTAVLTFAAFTQLAEVIVVVPYLLGLWLVAVMAAYMLSTHRGDIRRKGFLQPEISDAVSFTNAREHGREGADDALSADGGAEAREHEYAYDILQGEFSTAKTVEDEHGVSIVRPGLIPFLARVYGARSKIKNIESLTSRVKLPTSSPDEIFFVDPEADELLEYEPPGFDLNVPDWSREELLQRGVLGVAGLGAVWKLAGIYGSLVWLLAIVVGVYAVAKLYVEPTDGYARIEPAPLHFRQAFASTLMMSHGIRDAKDLQEAKKRWRLEKLKSRRESQQELDEFDRDMMDFMAGEGVTDEYEDLDGSGGQHAPPGEFPPEQDADDLPADGGDEQ